MIIENLDKSSYEAYDQFIRKHPELLLYYSLNYKKLLESFLTCDSEYLIAKNEKNEIQGILPLMKKEGKYGSVYNSLPFYGSNGGVFGVNDKAIDSLLTRYNEIASSDKTACSVYIENPFYKINHGVPLYNYLDHRIGQISPIAFNDKVEEALMNSFHTKTRNMVRKSQKSEFKVQINNKGWDFLIRTHHENMESIGGKEKPSAFFEDVKRCFQPDTDFAIYEAVLDSQPIASMLIFKFNCCIEYFTPVIKQEFRSLQPLSSLIYNAMIDASKAGFKYWNWGGTWSSQEGVYRFKSRWNAKDLKYTYYIRLNNKEILNATAADVLEAYPYFYLVPFSELNQG